MGTRMAKIQIDLGNYSPVDPNPSQAIIYRSWGWDKVGKNHFGYTMPDPIFGLYLDPAGTRGVAQKFLKGVDGCPKKNIYEKQFRFNKKRDSQDDAKLVRDEWMRDYEHALSAARSIQWDESETWELFRFAEFGRESAKGREYGPLNGLYRGLIQDAFDAGVNLQLIQKVKVKWVAGESTSDMEPMGFGQAGNIVQVSLEHSYDPDHDADDAGFRVKIVNCRQNTACWGLTLNNLTFPELGTLVYPETSEEDWR